MGCVDAAADVPDGDAGRRRRGSARGAGRSRTRCRGSCDGSYPAHASPSPPSTRAPAAPRPRSTRPGAGRTSPPCVRAPVNRHRHNYQPVQTDPRDELTHSFFHSRIKTSFSANPSHRSPSFFSSWIHCTWIPQTEDCTVREKLLNMNFTEF